MHGQCHQDRMFFMLRVLQPLGNDDLATSHIRGRAPCVALLVLVLLSKDHMYDKELLEISKNFTEP